MKVLITGSSGFIGSRLIAALREGKHEPTPSPNLDLCNFSTVREVFKDDCFDAVIHLAGISHVPTCEGDPGQAYQVNTNGTALLLEAIGKYCPGCHLIFASTAQVYLGPEATGPGGDRNDCWTEERPVKPQNVYARTKRSAEVLIQESASRQEIKSTVFRLFNHTHKSQSPDFFLPHLYSRLQAANDNTETMEIPVGNLQLKRDIGGISDLVQAFLLALENPPASSHEMFNVCSGTAKNLQVLADLLAERMGVNARYVVDQSRLRPGEPKVICGSHDKFSAATGWQPSCNSEKDLIQAFLD